MERIEDEGRILEYFEERIITGRKKTDKCCEVFKRGGAVVV